MRIALVTAFRSEAAPLLGLLTTAERGRVNGVPAWQGELGSHEVRLVVCGAGPQNAADRLLKTKDFLSGADMAVNFGVCGALDTSVRLHAMVGMKTVAAVYHHDHPPVQLAGIPDPGDFSRRDGALVSHVRPVFDSRVAERLARTDMLTGLNNLDYDGPQPAKALPVFEWQEPERDIERRGVGAEHDSIQR